MDIKRFFVLVKVDQLGRTVQTLGYTQAESDARKAVSALNALGLRPVVMGAQGVEIDGQLRLLGDRVELLDLDRLVERNLPNEVRTALASKTGSK